ncbi:MAG: hypothetical protein ACLR3R_19960 [Clostridium paraputrificum]
MSNKLYDFYCNYFVNWMSGGALVNKTGMSSLGIKPLYDRIITKSSVKKVICVSAFPVNYDKTFSSTLSRKVSETYRNCKVNICMQSFKSDLNVRSADFKRNMADSERKYNDYKRTYDSLSESDRAVGRKIYGPGGASVTVTSQTLNLLKDNFESYKYCNDIINNNGTLYSTYLFIELVAPDNATMIKVRDLVYRILDSFQCVYFEIHSNSSKYMETIAPAGFMKAGAKVKEFHNTLLSHENMAQLMPYKSHGFIGDGTGTLMGIDRGSRAPFILNFFKTGDRQINIFLCPSGKGKTVSSFMIALSLLDAGIHCSVIDVKGDEWVKLAPFTKLLNIDISSSNGVYVNTLRMDDVPVDISSSISFFESCINSTANLMKVIIGYPEGSAEERSSDFIVRNALNKLYSRNNVRKENPKTFANTAHLKYMDLVSIIQEIGNTPGFVQYSNIIHDIINRCSSMFEDTSLFKGKEITVRDIIDTPLVIYSLSKNESQGDSLSDAIRTCMVSDLDMKKIYMRKKNKLGTCCFYEEMQRKAEFRSLIKFICGVVTGARSSNVTVFLLCNTPSILMDADVQAITSNISTYIIGPLNKNDMGVLEYLGLSDIIHKVQLLSTYPGKYKHCFVCKFDTGEEANSCIYSAIIPPHILEKLKTRDAISS